MASACRPRADQTYPTLEENFKRSKGIYFATVLKSVPVDSVLKLELRLEKSFKGTQSKEFSVRTGKMTTCDQLAWGISAGDACMLFELPDGKLLTSLFDGEASFCLPKGSTRLKNVLAEYTEKFKFKAAKSKP
jgi:hypothetical protein